MKDSEEAAFVAFVNARSAPLLRFACLLTGNVNDAEDLLQSALAKLAGHWSSEIRDPNAYVKRTLVNLANNRWRRHGRRDRAMVRSVDLTSTPDIAEAQVEADALTQALRLLSDRQRLMVVLRYVEGMSEREAADFANCSIGTVKSHSSRGLERLRLLLAEPVHDSLPTEIR